MISCLHDHFLDDQLLSTPHLYFLYFSLLLYLFQLAIEQKRCRVGRLTNNEADRRRTGRSLRKSSVSPRSSPDGGCGLWCFRLAYGCGSLLLNVRGTNVISLRVATAEDEEWMFALYRLAFEEHISRIWGWDDDWQAANFDDGLRRSKNEIVELSGEAIGFVRLSVSSELYLDLIALSSEFHGRGLGCEVISELKRRRGKIQLKVFATNLRAREFYLREGFKEIEKDSEYFSMVWQARGDAFV